MLINKSQFLATDASSFLIFYLVLWAADVPIIKKHGFFKRKLFVTVSNAETTAQTADVPVERQMAKWDQTLDLL